MDTRDTPFLQGLMAPVSEERDDHDLTVIGEIPRALRGMFVRTGPNPQFAPMGAYHPFDGDGMLHAVYLEDGTARYRNRFIESKGLLAERRRGRACGSTIEVRAPRMPDMPGGFQFEHAGAARAPLPWRSSIDLATGRVSEGPTGDTSSEFPRVDDRLTGRPTRYGDACPQRTWEFEFDFEGVYKYDFHTDAVQAHLYAPTDVCSEHVFAPDPNGTAEDDGWLLSFVTDRATERSELVILDAGDVASAPVARVQMAARVPIGFHANWFAD